MVERKVINFLLWTPLLFTGRGTSKTDGSIDVSTIYGQIPIVGGSLMAEDIDPEHNVENALSHFQINRDRKRIFKRIITNQYIIPDGLLDSSKSANLIINAYTSNNLAELGLPYIKDPGQLNLAERDLLMEFGYKALETSLLSKYNLKSFENYDHFKLCEQNLKNIGKAYRVSENTSKILNIENIPDLKSLYLNANMSFESIFNLRYKSTVKYFRKWINDISESKDSLQISKEYLNEIKDSKNFFNSFNGKLVKNIGVFGIGTVLGNAIAGTAGQIAGFALGLLDTFYLDNILKGNNPSMFIKDIEDNISKKSVI